MRGEKPVRIALIGATGSVGRSVVQVCKAFPERFVLHSMAACRNGEGLVDLQKETGCRVLVLAGEDHPGIYGRKAHEKTRWMCGDGALEQMATDKNIDSVVAASSGVAAAGAIIEALRAGKRVCLANKESLIAAGKWITGAVQYENQLLPLDSEHNAIWQCLGKTCNCDDAQRIILTASGGPFLDVSPERLSEVTQDDVLRHPVWSMGPKITVDSATMMNKGFETIEAGYLFQCEADRISAVIHPESRIHGMVDFRDGTRRMAAFAADMRIPILSALAYPDTLPCPFETCRHGMPTGSEKLSFREIDMKRFPCYRLAREVFEKGGGHPAFLVGADEEAVSLFLQGKIPYRDIPALVEAALRDYDDTAPRGWEEAVGVVGQGRRAVQKKMEETGKLWNQEGRG
ncbi:MAG: 1-deoxy-D-xylulose-5-phosphate reductoisomerase [Thermovirgaceae bacterium]